MKDIPVSVILEQSQRYTNSQLKYLYDENITLTPMAKHSIKKLYTKAESLGDETVMDILVNKYDMLAIFDDDVSGLPQVTKESTDKAFKDIYELIKKINPYDDEVSIAKRDNSIKKYNKKGYRNRRYGGNVFRDCFKEIDGKMTFCIRKYLYKTSTENVRNIAKLLDIDKGKLTILFPELIELILEEKLLNRTLLRYLRLVPDPCPIPLEDIVDMEQGKTQMVKRW